MKLKGILLMVFISASTFAQDTAFKFSKEGLTDFIVTSYDSPAKDLFKRTVAWVKENNKSADAVKSVVEDEKITFQGVKDNFLCSKAGGTTVCSNATYTIEITFKDGKYKFAVTDIVLKDINGKIARPNLDDFSEYYDKDGNVKKYLSDAPNSYEGLFNGLNQSLVTYMDKKKKADNW
ncbi:DUF4468 domain-containing protein [Flavobacterium sp. N1994]|uniref:DUF4468 domain-containing protein n=1 Tax=Flavobacterium sp. N1994 TaxID=2986827 RepID=UPI00222136B3|nr:DUF4468 domain-containing protein [Flavobacterium sp. N1994]